MFKTAMISVLILAFGTTSMGQDFAQASTKSTFIWHAERVDENINAYVEFMIANQVTDIYIQQSRSLPYTSYERFNAKMHEMGIDVYLLGGAPNWVSTKGKRRIDDFLEWLKDYQDQADQTAKFDGVILDVEYYLYKDGSKYIERYKNIVLKTGEFAGARGLKLATTIPFWLDSVKIRKDKEYPNLAEWNIAHSDETVIMAYRNEISGANGVVSIVSDEISYANGINKKIIVALETVESDEGDHVSFYGYSKNQLNNAIDSISYVLDFFAAYEGVSVHYLDTWMQMQ